MNKLRKFLNVSVMVMTILVMSGFAAFTPNVAMAAASAGDLIKMEGNSSVYYFDGEKRFVFPNETTYMSWYSDFSGVVTIEASELQSYPLGGNVTMRPGTKLVKITTDPSVYAVEPNGVLRKIQNEAQAAALYGTDWAKRVVDVPDAFFVNYTIGQALASGEIPAGTLVKTADSAAVYYFDGSEYREISSESAMNANRFSFSNVITIEAIAAGGDAITGMEEALVDTAQGATTGSGPVVTGSGLMVSLNSATPAAMSVPNNASRVNFASVNLTAANDGNVSVNSLNVKRVGLSNYDVIEKVWAEKDGIEITSKKSMNSNSESILTFSPALNVPAGQTVTIDLVASLDNASGNIGLSIVSASAVNTTAAAVTGSFPIQGNLMSPTDYAVADVTLHTSGSGAVSPSIGEEDLELAAFELSTDKDVILKSVTLKNNGVEDLSTAAMNIYLESVGSKVSENTVIDGRYITFYLGDLEISKDDASKIFKVKGDIISKENTTGYSFDFVVNKSSDISVFEKATGFGANVIASSNFEIGTVTIDSGIVTVSKDVKSPSNFSIIKGDDKTALIAKIKTDEAIIADGLNINYTGSDVNSFENVRVYLNSILLDSFDFASTDSNTGTSSIETALNLNAGDNKIEIKVRSKNTATSSANVRFSLSDGIFSSMNPEYSVSGNLVESNEITGSAKGATVTVEGASLQTVRNDGYGPAKTIVAGSNDVSLGKFVVDADNDDVTITSVYLSANNATGSTTNSSAISDMKLYVNGSYVKTANFGTSGSTFSSLNIDVDKDEITNLEIKGSFDTSATGNFQTTMTLNVLDSRGKTVESGNVATTTSFAIGEGSLEITDSGDAPTSGILASKAGVEQEVAEFKFTAVNDEANIKEINVINWDGEGTLASTTTATSSADARIASVRLYDGSTMLSSFVPVNGAGKFTITNDKLIVAANTSKTLTVKVVLNDIFNDENATNKELNIAATTLKFNTSAGAEVTQGVAKAGEEFIIRKTVPTVAYVNLPDSTLASDDMVIAKFTVAADSNGDVDLNKVVLNVSTSASTSIDTTTNSVKVNGSNKDATASYDGSNLTITFANNEVITAGTSKTFEVIAEITTNGENGEYVRTKIVEDSSFKDDQSGNFVWSDGAHITNKTYANGYLVGGLTTDNWTITK